MQKSGDNSNMLISSRQDMMLPKIALMLNVLMNYFMIEATNSYNFYHMIISTNFMVTSSIILNH